MKTPNQKLGNSYISLQLNFVMAKGNLQTWKFNIPKNAVQFTVVVVQRGDKFATLGASSWG